MSDRVDVAVLADDPNRPPPRSRPRTGLVVGVVVVLVALVAGLVFVVTRPDPASVVDVSPEDPVADSPPGPITGWTSGASGDGILDGEFDQWRGAEVAITGTWADGEPELQTDLPTLRGDGAEFEDWDRSLDIGIGAIGEGETWAEAAAGEYDGRWEESLTNLAEAWEGRSGTLYIRFAHEMNGDWYPWQVNAENYQDFITAWQRFRALQQEIFPESQLVFCLTRESVNNEIDWRETFPGAEYVDVVGVDYYNQFPYVETIEEFREAATETDTSGGPKGIQGYLDFAREQGLPLAVPEWSGNAGEGDSPAFIEGMYEIFAREGGSGPGQILYEILFNIEGYDDNFQLYPETAMPDSAERYRELW